MAKRQSRASSIDDVFNTSQRSARAPVKRKCFAVKQTRGPKGQQWSSLAVMAHDPVHARSQWFNYYGLHEQTYRYALDVRRLDEGHPLEQEAITCDSPRVQGRSITVDDLASQAFEDQQHMLKGGETTTVVEAM